MQTSSNLHFDDWVHYCFTKGHLDFSGTSGDPADVVEQRSSQFSRIDAPTLAQYLTALFEAPEFVADKYTDDQIAAATWYVFGVATCYISEVLDSKVAIEWQSRCLRSIATMYTNLFDRVCGKRGTDPDSELIGSEKVDVAVYMIWDMDNLQYATRTPEREPHLVEPTMEILRTVLTRCRTSSCIASALHGIGHLYSMHDREGHEEISLRLQQMVDDFLSVRDPPEWIREYAIQARNGEVL